MSEFKDSEGRKWRINLTLGGVKKVMDELGINLLDLTQFADTSDGSATLKLVNDDLFVGEIVAILLEKQAEGYGLKREDVLDLFDGATTKRAQEAFLEEYAFFFKDRENATAAKFVDEIKKAREMVSAGQTSADSLDVQV